MKIQLQLQSVLNSLKRKGWIYNFYFDGNQGCGRIGSITIKSPRLDTSMYFIVSRVYYDNHKKSYGMIMNQNYNGNDYNEMKINTLNKLISLELSYYCNQRYQNNLTHLRNSIYRNPNLKTFKLVH